MGIIKVVLATVGLGALVFAAIPLALYGIFNVGVAALGVLALLCGLQLYLLCESCRKQAPWEIFAGRGRWHRLLRRLLGVLLSLFLVAELALSAVMLLVSRGNTPSYSTPTTAVVLGCLTIGDKPSRMLENRLQQALLYLNQLPEAKVVVTGGQGEREDYPEAEIAAKWLTEQGIAPQRILLESQSLDSYQNIAYTATLLQQNSLPMEAVLFTDSFHQLRCQLYARQHGMLVTGVSSPTPWGLLPAYWLREQAALCEALLVVGGILPNSAPASPTP